MVDAISRTQPRYHREDEVREVEALFVESIARAERTIYIENQFFQSAFGEPSVNAASKAAMSGPMRYMLASPGNRITT